MEISNINTSENLLVHLQLVDSKTYAYTYCRTSELVCKRINVLTPEIPKFNQREYKIEIVNQVFNNSPENINELKLDNIKGIIPLNGNELLVTIIFDEKYYEVACEAILADTSNKQFTFIGLRTIDDRLFPKYDIEITRQIGTGRNDIFRSPDFINHMDTDFKSEAAINQIIWLVCNAISGESGIPLYNSDPKKNLYFTSHIHSIEILRRENQKNHSIKEYFQPPQCTLNKFRFWKSGNWCTQFCSLKIDYAFEDKILTISSKFEYTIKVRSDNMSRYYDDEEIRYKYLCSKKQFRTRHEMRIFIQDIENILIENKMLLEPTSNLEKLNIYSYDIVCNNIDEVFSGKFLFIEYLPDENGYYLNPVILKNYHQYASWFESNQ